jgi:NAD(P)-dependent dehydrogenase (short-subunit alcohol dehydrogenase family)
MAQFHGQLALVTGANRGIGLELVKQLAAGGARVLLGSRSGNGETVAQELRAQELDVTYLPLDIDNPDSIAQTARTIQEQYGRLDVLINNAGVCIDEEYGLLEIPAGLLERTMGTNFFGVYHLTRALLPLMQAQNYGRIINVSSEWGSLASMREPGAGAYKLSKLAVNGMTQLLAAEVTGNIRINAVCPGWVQTDMGGPHAPRTAQQAAEGILRLLAMGENIPNGGFFRDGQPISW